MPEHPHAARRVRPTLVAAISSGLLSALFAACAPELPIGRYACRTDHDCPEGWSCMTDDRGKQRCYPAGTDLDGPGGGGEPRDSGSDAEIGPADAGPMISEPGANPPTGQVPSQPAAGSGGSPEPPTAAGSGGGPAAGSGEPPPPAAGAPSEPPPPPVGGCKPEAPDASKGVFVSPSGVSAADCGTAAQPCATVQRGIARAKASNVELVYLDSGTYSEPVVLQAGLHLQGGYSRVQGEWTRSCDGNRAERARIQSGTEVGLWAEYDGSSVLETLTVETLALAPAGHSMYGVFARGSSTRLTLREVNVLAASGGNGPKGSNASTPEARTGTCTPAADGTNGVTAGRAGAPGAPGSFTDSGYVPGNGTPGEPGKPGKNGTQGELQCRDCYDMCNLATCANGNVTGQSCGMGGDSGCGGLGAAGGGQGLGGGSSIALFAWAARIEVEGGLLQAGDGGSGGLGGQPGQGGAGSDGMPGMNGATCMIFCTGLIIEPPPIDPLDKSLQSSGASASESPAVGRPVPIDGGVIAPTCKSVKGFGMGTAGGHGGSGSAGGPGGSGAGGNSYGAVAAGQGRLSISSSTRIELGSAGKSQGNGAAGEASAMKLVD